MAIDICFMCKQEKDCQTYGEFDNPVFYCEDCANSIISEALEYDKFLLKESQQRL